MDRLKEVIRRLEMLEQTIYSLLSGKCGDLDNNSLDGVEFTQQPLEIGSFNEDIFPHPPHLTPKTTGSQDLKIASMKPRTWTGSLPLHR